MKERAIYYGTFYFMTCYIYVRLLNTPCLFLPLLDFFRVGGILFIHLFVVAVVIVVALHNDVIPLHSFTGKKICPNIGSLVRTSTVFSYHACFFFFFNPLLNEFLFFFSFIFEIDFLTAC